MGKTKLELLSEVIGTVKRKSQVVSIDTNLVDDLGFTSLDLVELSFEIERNFGCSIDFRRLGGSRQRTGFALVSVILEHLPEPKS